VTIPRLVQDTTSNDLIDISQFILNHPRQHLAAKRISDILCPPILGIFLWGLLATEFHSPVFWLWTGLFLGLCVGVPTLYVVWLTKTAQVSDFHIPIRSQRIKPMLLMLLMFVASIVILLRSNPPAFLAGFAIVGLGIMTVLFLITLKWKISGHALTASIFCVVCMLVFGGLGGFSFILVPLVAWARVRLRRHTIRQVIAGTLLGLSSFAIFYFRG
jgi:membrane-associated phospholipid phosphatase